MCHLGDNVPCAHAMLVFLVKAVCVAYQLLLVMPLGWCYRNLVSWNPLESICVSIETMLGNWIENSLWTIPLHSWNFLIVTLLHAIFSGWSIVFYLLSWLGFKGIFRDWRNLCYLLCPRTRNSIRGFCGQQVPLDIKITLDSYPIGQDYLDHPLSCSYLKPKLDGKKTYGVAAALTCCAAIGFHFLGPSGNNGSQI